MCVFRYGRIKRTWEVGKVSDQSERCSGRKISEKGHSEEPPHAALQGNRRIHLWSEGNERKKVK
jgi:hypothetical protein